MIAEVWQEDDIIKAKLLCSVCCKSNGRAIGRTGATKCLKCFGKLIPFPFYVLDGS